MFSYSLMGFNCWCAKGKQIYILINKSGTVPFHLFEFEFLRNLLWICFSHFCQMCRKRKSAYHLEKLKAKSKAVYFKAWNMTTTSI